MCGIAGYFGSRGVISEAGVEKCLTLMSRRGPDHCGFIHKINPAGKHIYLLHSRLKILDLDNRSNQPFNAGSKWITYNGELYNYVELRSDLIRQGYSFNTTSDTEVLLQSINCYGLKALERFEGMWAFAVYDETAGTLMLCRDRFGEKPLYIYSNENGIYFGSEIKFIFALMGKKLPININHIYRGMFNGYRSLFKTTETFFEGLTQLEPSSAAVFDANGKSTHSAYWDCRVMQNETITRNEAVLGVRERLIHSVELRLRSDVPLAFCVSGGVDSNALISIAKNVLKYDVHGFTITNTDAHYEEQEMIEYAVSALGIKHTSVAADPKEGLSSLRTLINYHDGPILTTTYFVHWLLMKHVAECGYRIAVGGIAADELFSGYYDHHLAYLYEMRNEPEIYSISLRLWQTHILPHVRNPHFRNPNLFAENPGFRDYLYHDPEEFNGYLVDSWEERFTESRFTEDLLRNRMLNELFHETVPITLHEEDLNSMYYSIENRSPYLDRELFEFCCSIPTRHLIDDGYAKSLLRDAMAGIVPPGILQTHKKVGFNAPVFSFIDVKDPMVYNYIMDDSPVYSYIRRNKIETLINKTYLSDSENKFLFSFINAKIFMEDFSR